MKAEVVIVGGGIIGLYSAYLLALNGSNITIIDRGEIGRESTWAAGGILAPLLPWDYAREILFLTNNAAYEYEQLSNRLTEQLNCDIEYWKCGLTVHTDKIEPIVNWCQKHNYKLRLDSVVNQYNPSKQIHLREVAQVRTPALINALVKLLESLGVNILTNTSVNKCLVSNNQLVGIDTCAGKIHSPTVIWATGAWTPKIYADDADIKTPHIIPIKGQVIALNNSPVKLMHILFKQGHYLIPRKDGLILAGSTLEDAGYEKSATEIAREMLWQKSIDLMPELIDSDISHHWTGLRPASPNNIPTIGPHPEIKGLFYNCGHFRYGLTMAPKSSEILTNWVLHDGAHLTPEDKVYSKLNS